MRGNRFFVPRRKLTKYLLNPNHEAGRAKARFLLSKGFSWYIEEGEATFVTAYPAGTRDRCHEATGA
jgi:hypothetical protein